MTDILNLPKWNVTEVEEAHDEYIIKARYTVQPEVCLSCGVIHPKLYRYGTKQQPFRDLPIHGKVDWQVDKVDSAMGGNTMTTGQAMDMPDSAGWWAFEGYINYAKGANPNETMREVVRVFWGKTTQAWQTVSINGRHPAYMLIGKWHKFTTPWEPQPPTTVQAMDDNGLLPCPFCGGEGHCEKKGNSVAHYVVLCNGCRTKMIGTQQDDAIAAWNRRTTTPTLSPQSVASDVMEAWQTVMEYTSGCLYADDYPRPDVERSLGTLKEFFERMKGGE